MKKKALGKGLKAFLPEEYGIMKEERYAELDIEKLKPSSLQPRLKFNENSIGELASSMKESGILGDRSEEDEPKEKEPDVGGNPPGAE